jgi:hypothetical protein
MIDTVMLRKLFAPIRVRFFKDDELLAALDMVERGYSNPKCEVDKKELERMMIILGRELIRRKVVFWI